MTTSYLSKMAKTQPKTLVKISEEKYHDQIRSIAEDIIAHKEDKPIILVSGPSGSGKTTPAVWLEKFLDENYVETHTLSMDNFFKPLDEEQQRLAKEHKLDLETPERMDAELLNEQLKNFLDYKPVTIPTFDFVTNTRVEGGEKTVLRKPGELLILEGIHALNPIMTGDNDDFTSRIYISVRTRVTDSKGDTMHPKYVRVLRRMIRDKLFRGRLPEGTLAMLDNVTRGENLFIMPYKNRATYEIDTFHDYELCLYKQFLLDDTRALVEKYPFLQDVVNVLEELESLDVKYVPEDSMMREFIGGSIFDY